MLRPIVLSAKDPEIFVVESVTASKEITPTRVALCVSKRDVASAVASYTLFEAVMPEMVSSLDVTLAEVEGCVRV